MNLLVQLRDFIKTGRYSTKGITSGYKWLTMLIMFAGLVVFWFVLALLSSAVIEILSINNLYTEPTASITDFSKIPPIVLGIATILSAFYISFTFHWFLTDFDIKKVRLSASLLFASVVYRFLWRVFLEWSFVDAAYAFYLNMIILVVICYLLSCLLIRDKYIGKLAGFWQTHFKSLVYGSAIMLALLFFMPDAGPITALTRFILLFTYGLVLSFIRIGFGLKYSMLLSFCIYILFLLLLAVIFLLKAYMAKNGVIA